ncbi:hypothetical protein B6U66_05390 [Candidatus Bathyarchaeota archaeon ex4484_135]|nr:MAG: hypothetical protein B6U66_05390 [Candidatus Bathyarchaeota archaeon ex4484_135]
MSRELRITAFVQGWYGERIVKHIRSFKPDWGIWLIDVGKGFPRLPDDDHLEGLLRAVVEKVPEGALRPDIALFLLEEPGASLLMPSLAELIGARSVLCPVDDYKVVPRGLERQLSEELLEAGIPSCFPRPFCSLSHGPGPIGHFARYFGMPEVELEVQDDVVKAVKVLRGAPCGSTHYAASRLVGSSVQEAPRLAGLFVQTYPCLASHVKDPLIGEDMIGLSAKLAKAAVEKCVKKARGGRSPRPR